MTHHLESIQRFSPKATQSTVDNIVKHLGIAMKNPDSATVATSDKKELDSIRDGFCAKHLELDADQAEKLIQEVAEVVKHDAAKSRVTFYYLLAEKADRLDVFE